MPLYNYYCEKCEASFEAFNSIEERNRSECPSCGSDSFQGFSAPKFHRFPEGVFEHIAADPIYVSDKRQMKDECKRHGVYAPNILD